MLNLYQKCVSGVWNNVGLYQISKKKNMISQHKPSKSQFPFREEIKIMYKYDLSYIL